MKLKSLGKQALLVGGLVAILGGCKENDLKTNQTRTEIIAGKPVSVFGTFGDYWGGLAVVLEIDGMNVLASTSTKGYSRISEAVALIQSEISDGDNEKLELTGEYRENHNSFKIESVRVNNYTVNF